MRVALVNTLVDGHGRIVVVRQRACVRVADREAAHKRVLGGVGIAINLHGLRWRSTHYQRAKGVDADKGFGNDRHARQHAQRALGADAQRRAQPIRRGAGRKGREARNVAAD